MLLSMVLYMTGWRLHSMILRLQPSRPFNAFSPGPFPWLRWGWLLMALMWISTRQSDQWEKRRTTKAPLCSPAADCPSPGFSWEVDVSRRSMTWNAHKCSSSPRGLYIYIKIYIKPYISVTKPRVLPYIKLEFASLFYTASKFSWKYNPRWSNITCTFILFSHHWCSPASLQVLSSNSNHP